MARNNYFGNYTLSQDTLDKLKDVDKILKSDTTVANLTWGIIKPKQEIEADESEDEQPPTRHEDPEYMRVDQADTGPASTQFFYSQEEIPQSAPTSYKQLDSSWCDVAESLYESLESTNTTLSLVDLTKLNDAKVDSVVNYLSKKLSLKGTYNLCHSVCAMNADRSMIFIKMICSNLLLQKVINLEEPSRLMSSLIHELVERFPEDIQEFMYIPMLNAELRDTSVISAMIDCFPLQRKMDLITNFLTLVRQLKQWHVNVLPHLMKIKLTDNAAKDKLLGLLLEKASTHSRDKNYGKIILSCLKLNSPFTEDQKSSLSEIVAVNETIFKRVMENLLKNMYFHNDLWHIS